MTPMDDRLRELLTRAIFIPKSSYPEIPAADALTQKEILDGLEQMDKLQTGFFSRILDKSPWFFEEHFQRQEAEEAKQRQGSDKQIT